jgi:hypothetical protein
VLVQRALRKKDEKEREGGREDCAWRGLNSQKTTMSSLPCRYSASTSDFSLCRRYLPTNLREARGDESEEEQIEAREEGNSLS